jgi:ribonuclease T2
MPFATSNPAISLTTLWLSWAPTHCLGESETRDGMQCDPDKPDDFVLHGFWPQYAQGWPEDCRTDERPWVPSAVIDDMRDIMPTKAIVIHEYRTHGTCTGLAPEDYFAMVRKAYGQVTIPAAFDAPKTQSFVSPDDVKNAFVAANNGIDADMIAVQCRRGNLFDVRICFSDDLEPRTCGAIFNQKALCPLQRITVTVP